MSDALVRAGLLGPDDAAGFLRGGHFAYEFNAGLAVLACFLELQALGATVVALGGLVLRASPLTSSL